MNVTGHTKQYDGYICGNHISMYMINFKHFMYSNALATQMLENDPNFERTIGQHPSFQFDGVVDLDQLKAEMRTFFLRICMILSKVQDQKRCKTIIDNIINMFEHTLDQEMKLFNVQQMKYLQKMNKRKSTKILTDGISSTKCQAQHFKEEQSSPEKTLQCEIPLSHKKSCTKIEYSYAADDHSYLVGKTWYCSVHSEKNVGFLTLMNIS